MFVGMFVCPAIRLHETLGFPLKARLIDLAVYEVLLLYFPVLVRHLLFDTTRHGGNDLDLEY